MDPPAGLVRSATLGHARVLTLDHPPVNVLSRPVLERLRSEIEATADDESVRAVVLASAAEKAFAAGADIRAMAPMGPDEAHVHGALGQSVTRAIERLPLPVIAAVHGVAYGGGLEICLACDFILASEDAQFASPEINLGIIPGWGGSRRLPRRVGPARARRWILTGRSVPASEALAAGLVDRVLLRAELLPAALSLAEELATRPALALAAAKYALLEAIDPGIDAGLAYELDLWARLFGTEGQREGMGAFLAKRRPDFGSRSGWAEASAGFPWNTGAPRSGSTGKRKNPGGSGAR